VARSIRLRRAFCAPGPDRAYELLALFACLFQAIPNEIPERVRDEVFDACRGVLERARARAGIDQHGAREMTTRRDEP